jgi:hypothetical protein
MVAVNANTAYCTVHGGKYRILFSRVIAVASETPHPETTSSPDNVTHQELITLAPPGVMCGWHPTVTATQRCHMCGAVMCNVCDFPLPNGTHLCPVCVTAPVGVISDPMRKHRNMLIWSYVLPAVATMTMILFFLLSFSKYPSCQFDFLK